MLMAWLGGMLIGLSAFVLYAGLGRIAGISGITYSALESGQRQWRLPFLIGLLAGPWLALILGVRLVDVPMPASAPGWALLLSAGFMVGFGTRLGNGCTSGHGICGLSRLSPRSLSAVALFMAVGILTATLLRPLLLGVLS
jgi:uncharacterized protein